MARAVCVLPLLGFIRYLVHVSCVPVQIYPFLIMEMQNVMSVLYF